MAEARTASARSNGSAAAGGRSNSSGSALSFAQATELNARKDALKEEHLAYIEEHPELKDLLSDFLSQVLLMKPRDICEFARDYFRASLPAAMGADGAQPQPLIICGPSGAGKGTLVKRLFSDFGHVFALSVSHTTRAPRQGEEDGVHYHFSDREAMAERIAKGGFVEHAEVHGNLYGTSFEAVRAVAGQGKVCILEIDVQGVQLVRRGGDLQTRCVYVAPPSLEVLEKRLRDRGTESEDDLEQRLGNARDEMAWLEAPGNVDRKVVNDDLEQAYADLLACLREWYTELREAVSEDGRLVQQQQQHGKEEQGVDEAGAQPQGDE